MAVTETQPAGQQPTPLFPKLPPQPPGQPFTPVRPRPPGVVWDGGGVFGGVPLGGVQELSCRANPPQAWELLLAGGRGGFAAKGVEGSNRVLDHLTLPRLSKKQAEQMNRGVLITVCGVGITWAMVETGALAALLAL